MELIKNQPVTFDLPEPVVDCTDCDENYVQLVKQGDVTQFQVKIGDCWFPENKIANGSFSANLNGWDNVSGWVWDDGKACNTSTSLQGLGQSALTAGRFYRVEIVIDSLEATSDDPSAGTVLVTVGTVTIGEITSPGTYVFYGVALNTGFFNIIKYANTEVCVDDVSAFEISIDQIIAIYDIDDNFITSLKVSDFINSTTHKTPEFVLIQNYLTIKIDWSDLTILSGDCYYFCLLDPCVNTDSQNFLNNGEFEIPSTSPFVEWTLTPAAGAAMGIANGLLSFIDIPNPLGTISFAEQLNIIGNNCEYTIEIKINSIVDTGVTVRMGTVSTSSFSTVGVHTETITSDGTNIQVRFRKAAGTVGNCDVEYIRLTINPIYYQCDHVSNIFKLEDSFPFCNLRINVAGDHNIFDLQFTDDFLLPPDFTPTLRLEAKLVHPQYELEKDLEKNTDGTRFLKFFERTKRKSLKMVLQPEYIHDFLSLSPGYDHFYIETTEYVVEDDEYPLSYEELDNIASLVIEVMEKAQPNVVNVRCTDANFPQVIEGMFLLDPDTGDFIFDPSDDLIVIKQPG